MSIVNEAYAVIEGTWQKVADDWTALTDEEKAGLFAGVDSSDADANDIAALGKVVVYNYRDTDEAPAMLVAAIPPDKTILPEGLISTALFEQVNSVTFAGVFAADSGGFVKFAFTADSEAYKVYDGAEWQEIDLADFAGGGMAAEQVHALGAAALSALLDGAEGFGIGIYISQEAIGDNLHIDTLTVNAQMRGNWGAAVHGTDFTYAFDNADHMVITLASAGTYKINYDKGMEDE